VIFFSQSSFILVPSHLLHFMGALVTEFQYKHMHHNNHVQFIKKAQWLLSNIKLEQFTKNSSIAICFNRWHLNLYNIEIIQLVKIWWHKRLPQWNVKTNCRVIITSKHINELNEHGHVHKKRKHNDSKAYQKQCSLQIEIYAFIFAFTTLFTHISNHLQKSLLATNMMAHENTMMKHNNNKL
jgi:hypothetical protein